MKNQVKTEDSLDNCWDLIGCGKGPGNPTGEECLAVKTGMGHSCWIMVGTFCGGDLEGEHVQSITSCVECKVYKLYNRINGTQCNKLLKSDKHLEENKRYFNMIFVRGSNYAHKENA
jgi:hypothetical protein